MKSARVIAASLLAAAPLAMSLVACDPPAPWTDCGAVDSVPHSDVGAGEIKAHNTDCETARQVAHVVYVYSYGQPFNYYGFSCTGAVPRQGLGSEVWCNGRGGSVITFVSV